MGDRTTRAAAPRAARGPARGGRPQPEPGFGSNQAMLEQLALASQGAAASTAAGQRGQPPQVGQAPATRRDVPIYRTLRKGSEGDEVEVLQRLLGLEGDAVDGDFGSGTRKQVMAWQEANGLKPDGVVGLDTVRRLRGDPEMYGYAWHHDPDKFVPAYAMTAYHESGIYRTKDDPYAVGAITRPDKDDDLGGKTYGTYQFESYVYRDGTKAGDALVDSSTVMRFVRNPDNPYGARLKAVVDEHGIASAEFDALWKRLSAEENKAFGEAQETFLEADKEKTVQAFLKRAGASPEVAADPDIKDLVMGSTNHVGTLANGIADHIAATQQEQGRKLTVDEFGRAVTDYKAGRVTSWFKSSPGAQDGIKARFQQERTVFE